MGLFLSLSFPIMQVSLGKSAEQVHISELKTKVKVDSPHSKRAENLYTNLEFCVCCTT